MTNVVEANKAKAAIDMRNLSKEDRDRLISEGHNVIDIRPQLSFKKRQRDIAEQYRKKFSRKNK